MTAGKVGQRTPETGMLTRENSEMFQAEEAENNKIGLTVRYSGSAVLQPAGNGKRFPVINLIWFTII